MESKRTKDDNSAHQTTNSKNVKQTNNTIGSGQPKASVNVVNQFMGGLLAAETINKLETEIAALKNGMQTLLASYQEVVGKNQILISQIQGMAEIQKMLMTNLENMTQNQLQLNAQVKEMNEDIAKRDVALNALRAQELKEKNAEAEKNLKTLNEKLSLERTQTHQAITQSIDALKKELSGQIKSDKQEQQALAEKVDALKKTQSTFITQQTHQVLAQEVAVLSKAQSTLVTQQAFEALSHSMDLLAADFDPENVKIQQAILKSVRATHDRFSMQLMSELEAFKTQTQQKIDEMAARISNQSAPFLNHGINYGLPLSALNNDQTVLYYMPLPPNEHTTAGPASAPASIAAATTPTMLPPEPDPFMLPPSVVQAPATNVQQSTPSPQQGQLLSCGCYGYGATGSACRFHAQQEEKNQQNKPVEHQPVIPTQAQQPIGVSAHPHPRVQIDTNAAPQQRQFTWSRPSIATHHSSHFPSLQQIAYQQQLLAQRSGAQQRQQSTTTSGPRRQTSSG